MVNLFFSYSHQDESLRNELEIHLQGLRRQGIIQNWHDRRIGAGIEVHNEISSHLEEAQIILLLVSSDFIASNYCYEIEMKTAMRKHEAKESTVIPVVLRPCDWRDLPFGKLLATPRDGKPITKFPNQDEAFLEVTLEIKRAAERFRTESQSTNDATGSVDNGHEVETVSPDVRSSNLMVRKTFSDREKDTFENEAFEYIANYFEGSLKELELRNPEIETSYRRIDANKFTATVYRNGSEANSCTISFKNKDSFLRGINMSRGTSSGSMTATQTLSVCDDGYNLFLTQESYLNYGSKDSPNLSLEGAAEVYWSDLIRPLQDN